MQNWIVDVRASQWRTLHDIKERYPSASLLPNNVIIFNVKGNHFRLEVQVALQVGVVAIKWIGTHAEYTRRFS